MDDQTALIYDLTESLSSSSSFLSLSESYSPSLLSHSSQPEVPEATPTFGALSDTFSRSITMTMPTIFHSNSAIDAFNNAIGDVQISTTPTSRMVIDEKTSNDVPMIDFHMLKLTLLSAMLILILCGDIFVLFALSGRKLRKNRMYFFLYHLSIADLLTGFGNVLPQLAWEAHGRFYGGNALCKFIKYVQILGPYLSSYVLVMTAIDRYQAICHPLSNSGASNTGSRTKRMIGIAWTISLVSCAPQVLIFSYQRVNYAEDVYECWATFPTPWTTQLYVTWYAISIFFVPFVILTYTHVLICREIWFSCNSKRASFLVHRKNAKFSSHHDMNTACVTGGCTSGSGMNINTYSVNDHYRNRVTNTSTKQLLRNEKKKFTNESRKQSFLRKWFVQEFSKLARTRRKSNLKYSESVSLQTTSCRNECCTSTISGESFPVCRENSNVHLCINPLPIETTTLVPVLNVRSRCCLPNSKSDFDISDATSKKLFAIRGGSLKDRFQLENRSGKTTDNSFTKKMSKPLVLTDHKVQSNIKNKQNAHRAIFRTERSSSEGSADPGSIQPVVPKMHRVKSASQCASQSSAMTNPRVHSMHGLTRAKIKTVKVTLVVISCYVACSCPFICVQLWSVYWPGAQKTQFWNGTTIAILMLLASLNSCVNPWIYLYFNPNLASFFFNRFLRQRKCGQTRRSNSDGQLNSTANQPQAMVKSAQKKTTFKTNGSSLSNERKYSPTFSPEVMPLEGMKDKRLFQLKNKNQAILREQLFQNKQQQKQQQLQEQLQTTEKFQERFDSPSLKIHRKVDATLTNDSTSNMTSSSVKISGSNNDSTDNFCTTEIRVGSGTPNSNSRRISVQLERAWNRLVQHSV